MTGPGYDRRRLPVLEARGRVGVAGAFVCCRGLRRERVGVSVAGSLTAVGIPKNCCSTASLDWPEMTVSLRNTVTVP
jgi:hypothetical protein